MKHKIAIRIEGGGYRFTEVDAESITIKGWEDFEFIYHHSKELFGAIPMVISEKTCGGMVAQGWNKKDCLKNAKAKLGTVSKDEFRKMIAENLKKVKVGKKKAK